MRRHLLLFILKKTSFFVTHFIALPFKEIKYLVIYMFKFSPTYEMYLCSTWNVTTEFVNISSLTQKNHFPRRFS